MMARVTVSPGTLPYGMTHAELLTGGVISIQYIRSKPDLADPFIKVLAKK